MHVSQKIENIILLTVDALRFDHVGCYGYDRNTPNMDFLGENGLRFYNSVAQGCGTCTSFTSIHTSTYRRPDHTKKLQERTKTLAKILQEQGYTTAAFHSNPWLSRAYNFQIGFDHFYDSLASSSNYPFQTVKRHIKTWMKAVENLEIASPILPALKRLGLLLGSPPYKRAGEINKRVFSWLDRHTSEKFFLWVHYMDPHRPYLPPMSPFRPYETAKLNSYIDMPQKVNQEKLIKLKKLYEAEVTYVDSHIGKLLKKLKEKDALRESLIFLLADHGEEFLEHGNLSHSGGPYEELSRIPLIVYGLKGSEGRKVRNMVRQIDIAPTILDLLKITPPKTFQGKSFLPYLQGKEQDEVINGALTQQINDRNNKLRMRAYRTQRWKLIGRGGKEELYDLKRDPKEQHDLSSKKTQIVKELRNKMKSTIQRSKKGKILRQINKIREKLHS